MWVSLGSTLIVFVLFPLKHQNANHLTSQCRKRNEGSEVRSWIKLGSATDSLCDQGQMTQPLWASGFFVHWEWRIGVFQSTPLPPTSWAPVPHTEGNIPYELAWASVCNYRSDLCVVAVQSLSHAHLFVTSWTAEHQAALSFTISRSLLKFMSIESVMLSNHLSLCCPHLLLPSAFQASRSFPVSQLFASGNQSIGALASASVLPMNVQGLFALGLTDLISLLSKGQESFPAPQFESINSLVLRLIYDPDHTSIHDYWKNHSFWLYRPLLAKRCQCFLTCCLDWS